MYNKFCTDTSNSFWDIFLTKLHYTHTQTHRQTKYIISHWWLAADKLQTKHKLPNMASKQTVYTHYKQFLLSTGNNKCNKPVVHYQTA